MRNNDLIGHSWPDHRAGAPRMNRRTMILAASCVALAAFAPGSATASGSAVTARSSSDDATLTSQSPIDFRPDEITFVDSLPEITFAYPPTVDVTLVNTGSPDEEKTVRADVPPGAAHIELSGERWELVQFHWHTPSEHQIEGQATPLEMHLVHHRSDGTAADGPFLVIGVFLEEGPENSALAPIFENIPMVDAADETVPVPGVDLTGVLPAGRESFRYSGSLTTPPFTEPVTWVVFAEPITVSSEQIAAFEGLFAEGNTREVQPLNDREVLSDAADRFGDSGAPGSTAPAN